MIVQIFAVLSPKVGRFSVRVVDLGIIFPADVLECVFD